jgi:hypothetical protein
MLEIKNALMELDMGQAGELTIIAAMYKLMVILYTSKIPETWNISLTPC